MSMYQVTMAGDRRSFFTDADPTNGDGFVECRRAEFKDSYTPTDKVQQLREEDAREALANGSSRTVRINPEHVALSIRIEP